MPDFDRRAFALIGILHEGEDFGRWIRFLDALRDAISPDAVALFAVGPDEERPGILLGSGIGVLAVSLGDFLRPRFPHPATSALPLAAVREMPSEVLVHTKLYQELLAPAGLPPGPGLVAVTERDEQQVLAATLLVPRAPGWTPKSEDRALLERLAPHLALARRLDVRLTERRHSTEALLAAFDHLVLGVVLLAASGRVSYVNRSAAEMLGLAPGFDDPSLAAETSDARTRAWQRLVGADRDWGREVLLVEHPGDGRRLQLLGAPLGLGERGGLLGRRFARAVFVGDPKRQAGDPTGVLGEIYGLTPGETRLTLLLLSDCSLEEASRLLGISRTTARSVLKRVFEKTGTNRQAALVRLLLGGFAQVRSQGREDQPERTRSPRRAASRR